MSRSSFVFVSAARFETTGVAPGPERRTPDGLDARPSIWVVAGTAGSVERFVTLGWSRRIPGPVLMDDFPDLLRTLRFP